jgi:hypothetical protein
VPFHSPGFSKEYADAFMRLKGMNSESGAESRPPDNILFLMHEPNGAAFSEGVNPVLAKDAVCYLDKMGVVQIKVSPAVHGEPFSDGLAAVATTLETPKDTFSPDQDTTMTCGGWGFIDKTGTFVISPTFEGATSFCEGLASVRINGKIGFIDKTGTFVIQPQYTNARSFSEGLAAVEAAPGNWGFIDKTGVMAISAQFAWADSFSQGLAPTQELTSTLVGKWGYIDKSGRYVIAPKFVSAKPFSEDLAAVAIGEGMSAKWGYVRTSGEYQIPPEYMIANSFRDGSAMVARKSYVFELLARVLSPFG